MILSHLIRNLNVKVEIIQKVMFENEIGYQANYGQNYNREHS